MVTFKASLPSYLLLLLISHVVQSEGNSRSMVEVNMYGELSEETEDCMGLFECSCEKAAKRYASLNIGVDGACVGLAPYMH